MNHTRQLVVGLILLLCAASSQALYTPNPAGRWQPHRFYLAGDFQFIPDKDLELNSRHTVELDDTVGFFVRPGYSLARNLTVYARLGVQSANHVDPGVAAGFGIQGAYVFKSAPAWTIGGAFDYVHWSADLDDNGKDIDWNEFQISPAVSYQVSEVPGLAPYAGVLLDFVDAAYSAEQDDPVGVLIGANFDLDQHIRLDAQFRVISETGFLFSVAYIF